MKNFTDITIINSLLAESKENLIKPIKFTIQIDTLDEKTGIEIEIKKEYTLKEKKPNF